MGCERTEGEHQLKQRTNKNAKPLNGRPSDAQRRHRSVCSLVLAFILLVLLDRGTNPTLFASAQGSCPSNYIFPYVFGVGGSEYTNLGEDSSIEDYIVMTDAVGSVIASVSSLTLAYLDGTTHGVGGGAIYRGIVKMSPTTHSVQWGTPILLNQGLYGHAASAMALKRDAAQSSVAVLYVDGSLSGSGDHSKVILRVFATATGDHVKTVFVSSTNLAYQVTKASNAMMQYGTGDQVFVALQLDQTTHRTWFARFNLADNDHVFRTAACANQDASNYFTANLLTFYQDPFNS